MAKDGKPEGRFYNALARRGVGQGAAALRRRALGLAEAIGDKLAADAAERALHAGIHATDLQVMILLSLTGTDGQLPAAELQKALGFTPGGVSRRIESMARRGLVERLPDPEDGRARRVRLTPAGAEVIRRPLVDYGPAAERIEAAFTPEEWDLLIALMTRLHAAFD